MYFRIPILAVQGATASSLNSTSITEPVATSLIEIIEAIQNSLEEIRRDREILRRDMTDFENYS
jgi:hypothetical protein